MQIASSNGQGQPILPVYNLAPGVTAEQAANAMGLAPGTWREITDEEAAELQKPTLEEARTAKLAEIVTKANAVKAALSASYSVLEESTWPQQEAGARAILDDAGSVKDDTAALILANAARAAAAVELVNGLAAKDGSTPEDFAARIAANADVSHQAGILTLLEQRGYESRAKAAQTVEEVAAIEVAYSVAAAARQGV